MAIPDRECRVCGKKCWGRTCRDCYCAKGTWVTKRRNRRNKRLNKC